MAQIRQEYLDEQTRRWMRPHWRKWWKPGHGNDPLYKELERVERKYRPDQLRVPRGSEGAGRWAYEGRPGRSGPGSHSKPASKIRIAARISPQRRAQCEEQYRLDTFICNTVRTRSCWAQAEFRYSQCLIGGYVPPIYH